MTIRLKANKQNNWQGKSMFRKRFWPGVAVLNGLAVVGMFAATVHAQQVERYSQGISRPAAKPVVLQPRDEAGGSTDETELVASLNGVVIVNAPDGVNVNGARADGVDARGDVAPEQVIAAAQTHLGKPVSLAGLDRLTRDMVLAFREAGMPVVNVVVPPQDISNGVVQIVAVVGRLGDLTVEGNPADPAYYTEGFTLSPGDVVEEAAVLDHLRWKSRRFHRRVDAIYAPGSSFGLTDIALDVKEKRPWTVFGGVDNTGSGSTGDLRFFGGFTAGDLFGLDHELSYQFTTSEHGPENLNAHVATYTLPVTARTDFRASGAYVGSSADVGPGTSNGESYYASGTFLTQLRRWQNVSWDARYGFEYKQTDNNFEFGGAPASGNLTEIGQFFGEIHGQRANASSATQLFAGVRFSPGGLFGNNDDTAFDGSRSDAASQYAYFNGSIDHTIFLSGGFLLNLQLEGQVATDRLLPSEMMYLGGMNSVRGFQENAVRGDHGILGRFEVYSPALQPAALEGTSARLFGFVDAGAVFIEGPSAPGEGDADIAGAGVGLSIQHSDDISLELAYGIKLDGDPLVADSENGRFHFRFTARF